MWFYRSRRRCWERAQQVAIGDVVRSGRSQRARARARSRSRESDNACATTDRSFPRANNDDITHTSGVFTWIQTLSSLFISCSHALTPAIRPACTFLTLSTPPGRFCQHSERAVCYRAPWSFSSTSPAWFASKLADFSTLYARRTPITSQGPANMGGLRSGWISVSISSLEVDQLDRKGKVDMLTSHNIPLSLSQDSTRSLSPKASMLAPTQSLSSRFLDFSSLLLYFSMASFATPKNR